MRLHRSSSDLAVVCLATLFGSEAAASAALGGVVSVLAGSGSCNDSKLVPGNTLQDTFALSGAAACSSHSATQQRLSCKPEAHPAPRRIVRSRGHSTPG